MALKVTSCHKGHWTYRAPERFCGFASSGVTPQLVFCQVLLELEPFPTEMAGEVGKVQVPDFRVLNQVILFPKRHLASVTVVSFALV